MATQKRTADYILEQIAGAGIVSARKMFGEYALYCDGKMVALICGDELFVKPTDIGRAYLGDIDEGQPYPGAKPCFRIDGGRWDDNEWLTELIRRSAAALPLPANKVKRVKRPVK